MENQLTLPTLDHLNINESRYSVSLATLRRSLVDYNLDGTSNRPAQHHDFFTWLLQTAEDVDADAIMEPIMLTKTHTKHMRNQGERTPDEGIPIERAKVGRCITRVILPYTVNAEGELIQPMIGACVHEKGISVALGANIKVCSNMMVLGGKTYTTFGTGRISLETLKRYIKNYLEQAESDLEVCKNTIIQLKEKQLLWDEVDLIVHDLYEKAVHANMRGTKDYILPLNFVTRMQEQVIKRKAVDAMNNMWDLTQAGTEHMKSNERDFVALYPELEKFNQYMIEHA